MDLNVEPFVRKIESVVGSVCSEVRLLVLEEAKIHVFWDKINVAERSRG